MKYTYRSKTYKLQNKLKIFLTILLAALISTTGYIISRDVLSKLDHEYFNETTQDGINIKVVGERGVIPNNSTLKIEKVTKEEKDSVDDSINEIKNNNMNTVESYTYDIKILDEEENEIEPTDEIKIIFTNDLIDNKNLDANIYHTSTDEENNLTTEVLKGEVEEDTITTKTDSFSYYTLEFTYNNLTYSIEGNSEVKLSDILSEIGLRGEVSGVSGSNDSLFSFEKKNNEWYVISHQAFQTREWMKVTIDDIEYEIIVTDATNYTITYNSGSDGQFVDGTTINVVSYSISTGQVTKYSHTQNLDDTGLQNGNYANSLNTNEVVKIPGATTLTVDVYYNGESVSYDWLSVWAGNYPSYTASSNRTSTGYVTTDMGAPDNNNKFGGSQSGSYTVNGNSLTNMGHCTLTIPGDSVTFGFRSDDSGVGKGYGYYAIISGFGEIRTITSGTYKEPIPNDADYIFKEWSQDPEEISTNTALTATYIDLLNPNSYGTYAGVNWKITGTGRLIIGKSGETQTYLPSTTRTNTSWPWHQYRAQITSIEFAGPVNGNESHAGMFYGCSATSTDLSNFNTSNVTDMGHMFSECRNLVSLDLSGFDTSNVTIIDAMFYMCGSLTSLDLSNFNTSNVTHMSQLFFECDSLTTLDISNFNTSNVQNMYRMFYSCQNLISLNLSFDTSNVTKMQQMFENCSGLTSLDLSTFNTSSVTNMKYMFENCVNLTSLDLSTFNTNNVTDMYGMFSECRNLVSLDLSNFDTSNVTDMYGMFSGCSNLTSLDLSNFNTSNVTTMQNMFSYMTKLNTLKLGTNWNFLPNNGLTKSWIRDGDTTIYTATELTNSYDGTTMAGTYRVAPEAYAEFDSSTGILRIFRDTPGIYTNGQKIGTKTYYTGIETITGTTQPKWYSKRSSITSVVIEDYFKPITAYCMFYDCSNLTAITGTEYLDTKEVTNMQNMFSGCSNLTSLDVSNFNTSNVINMNSMFKKCSSLTSLDVSGFDTGNVTSMISMFENCSSLINLDASNFDTSSVTTMSYMFYDCKSLINLDVNGFDTNQVNTMTAMFSGCINLVNIDVSNFETSNVTDMKSMFAQCSGLTSLDVSNFDTANVTNMGGMFGHCSNLESLDLNNFNTSNVTNMGSMFDGCNCLTSLNLSSFNTSNVEDMRWMFENCSSLISLDASNFDTANVTNMGGMFDGCSSLTSLDVSNFNTSKVTNMQSMFNNCMNLIELDVSNFDVSKTNESGLTKMFYDCKSLKEIDLSSFHNSVALLNKSLQNTDSLRKIIVSDYTVFNSSSTYLTLNDNKYWLKEGTNTAISSRALCSAISGHSNNGGTYYAVQKLAISEQVNGTLADINKNFNFSINVQDEGVGINATYVYTGSKSGNLVFNNGNATFSLKHGESISAYLPYDNVYTIIQNSDGYTLSKTNDTGTLSSDITSSFIDTLEGTTPTGIFLDLVPFIILITFGVFGIFLIRKFKYI